MQKAILLIHAIFIMLSLGCHAGHSREPAYPDWISMDDGSTLEAEYISGVGVDENAPKALYDALINLIHNHTGYYVTIAHSRRTMTLDTISVSLGPLNIEETASFGEDTLFQTKGYILYDGDARASFDELRHYEAFEEYIYADEKITRQERRIRSNAYESYYRLDRSMIWSNQKDLNGFPILTDILTTAEQNMTWAMFIQELRRSDLRIEQYYGPISMQNQDENYFGFRISVDPYLINIEIEGNLKIRARDALRKSAQEMFRELEERIKEESMLQENIYKSVTNDYLDWLEDNRDAKKDSTEN